MNRSIIKFRSEFSYLNLVRPLLKSSKLLLGVMSSQYRLFVRYPLLLATGLLCLMGTFSKRGLLDWRRMVDQNEKLEQKIEAVKDQKLAMERQIEQFQKNRDEQERVVRQVLGYVKPNETVIEFE